MRLVTRNRVVLLLFFAVFVLGTIGLFGLYRGGEGFISKVTSVFTRSHEEKGSLSATEALESKASLAIYEQAKRYTVFILNEAIVKDPASPEGVHFSTSLGSGWAIKDGGKQYIITANHVVSSGDLFYVQFSEQRKLHPARRIGYDQFFDLAVLELVDNEVVPAGYAKIGDSDTAKVNDQIYVFGSPLGMKFSWSTGRVMQTRVHTNQAGFNSGFITSDTTCNPGNSGGPAINARGEVIGIVDAIGGNNPICMVIPVNNFVKLWPKLKAGGEVRHGSLGLAMLNAWEVTPLRRKIFGLDNKAIGEEGLVIVNVVPGSRAMSAGIYRGDVLLRYGPAGKEPKKVITDSAEFTEELNLNFFKGDKIAVMIKRDDAFLLKELELVDMTPPPSPSTEKKGEEKKDQTPAPPTSGSPPPADGSPPQTTVPPGGGPTMPPEPNLPAPEKPPVNDFGM